MNRSQWAALAGVALLLAGAFGVRAERERPDAPAAAPAPDVAALQAAARLEPCPRGLGPELPDLELACLGGGADVDLRSAAPGRPTVVNLWATWCAPCVEEVPLFVRLADRAGDRLGLVGVLTQDSQANGLEFSRQFGIRYPSLVDPEGTVFRAFRPGLPITLFLDADGRVVHRERGQIDRYEELAALVEEHLGVTV